MSHAEIIVRMFAAIDNRRWDALAEFFGADAIYERPGYAPLRSLDDILMFYQRDRIIKHGTHRIERVVCDDEAACCWGSFEGKSKSDERLHEQFADVYRITKGKIVYRQTFFYRAAI